jgi:hypothetical protein
VFQVENQFVPNRFSLGKDIMKIKVLLISLLFIVVLCSCSEPKLVQPTTGYPLDVETGYPTVDYTIPSQEGYPIEDPLAGYTKGPEFHINLPVTENDSIITGTGPSGVPIVLVDVSELALILGETTIDADGSFSFKLAEPLTPDHTIGLMLGDIEGTEFVASDFLYSETYYERPMIGILFDMAIVGK